MDVERIYFGIIFIKLKAEFTENGTETSFMLENVPLRLITVSSGNRRHGLIHALFVNNKEIAAATS
jgi:hypothetical protein